MVLHKETRFVSETQGRISGSRAGMLPWLDPLQALPKQTYILHNFSARRKDARFGLATCVHAATRDNERSSWMRRRRLENLEER